MAIGFYMDENVSRQITLGLRDRKIDVLTVQEDGLAGISDEQVINRATEVNRVVFSRDDDLLAIAHDRQQSGLLFSGVIYAHQRTSVGVCIADLELIAQVYDLADCMNQVHFLPF